MCVCVCGVRAWVDVPADRGDEKEWNRGGQDDSPGRGVIVGALGIADEHHHEIIGVCGDVVREVDFCQAEVSSWELLE